MKVGQIRSTERIISPVPVEMVSLLARNSMMSLSVIIKNDSSMALLADWAKRLNIDPALET